MRAGDARPPGTDLRLTDGWELAAASAGAVVGPSDSAGLDWRVIGAAGPVAAVRVAGQGPEDPDACDWWYRLRLPPAGVGVESLLLDCEGLAGECEAWFNGIPLGRARNMHVRHRFDVRRDMGMTQELLLCFRSLTVALQARRPRPRWRVPMLAHQQLRWFRTSLLGRAPGWSPPWPPIGPWRPVRLIRPQVDPQGDPAAPVLRLLGLQADFDPMTGHGRLRLEIESSGGLALRAVWVMLKEIESEIEVGGSAGHGSQAGEAGAAVQAVVSGHRSASDRSWAMHRHAEPVGIEPGRAGSAVAHWRLETDVGPVRAWWPHTHGRPARYRLRLRIETEDGGIEERVPGLLAAVGFRRIEIDRSPGVAGGSGEPGFALKVNGLPIFCRGACWTPMDPLAWREDAARTEALLETVCRGGLNMLRVMGTMVYEGPHFHETCDRLGILVWQDLMFANMDYPFADPDFVEQIEAELDQQMQALIGRPSLAVVCGNSETAQQAAMWGAAARLWVEGNGEAVLLPRVRRWLPEVCWWPSSAMGGAFPHQVDAGTCSYYGVGAYRRPLSDARLAGLRFATECLAFAQVPGSAALARLGTGSAPQGSVFQGTVPQTHDPRWKAGVPRDLGAGWDFDDVRDHYLASEFGVDPQALRSREPERYLRLSAAVTGELMRRVFADWRRPESACAGALVLWLRDLRTGAGWGLFDERDEPKPVWHRLAEAWQPLAALITDEGNNGLVVQLCNERADGFQGRLHWQACRRGTRSAQASIEVDLAPRESRSVSLAATLESWSDLNGSYGFGPPAHDGVFVELLDAAGQVRARDTWFLGGPALAVDPGLGLRASARRLDAQTVEIEIETEGLAAGVRLDVAGHTVEDEGFHLPPGGRRRLRARRRPEAGPFWRASIDALNAPGPAPVALVEAGTGQG